MITLKSKKFLVTTGAVLCLMAVLFFYDGSTAAVDGEISNTPYYQGEKGKNAVAFAMNVDWGTEYIPGILSIFQEKDIKITFFLTGRWCQENPDTAKAIYSQGMEIGNHGLKHRSPNAMSYEENKADIEEAESIINDTLGIKTMLFAPASGEIEDQVLNAAADLGYKTILWSADTIDWQKPKPDVMTQRVLDKAEDGTIVLMHPTENTLAALPQMIEGIREKGLEIVAVSTLLK